MVYPVPQLSVDDRAVIGLIDGLREALEPRVADPRRWSGGLRRMTFARAVQGSNSIEGYNATLDDVVAAVDGEATMDADTETQLALTGYRDAMTYVLQMAQDDASRVDEGLLKALHFMMLRHDLSKHPGRWRPGPIFVRRESDGEIVYEGPDRDLVEGLIREMLDELEAAHVPVIIRASMAHLNLVMIHPFKDGNGRMARCLQTLVLSKEKILAPVFSSIEEYLGKNTQAYYDVLATVGRGGWHPENDAHPWIRFCLTAHYRQAKTHLRRIEESEALWVRLATIVQEHGLPERSIGGLWDASLGLRLRNSSYRSTIHTTDGEEISELTASRDLKLLVEAGLLDPVGERRGRYYVGTGRIRRIWVDIRNARPPRDTDDPYEIIKPLDQLELAL